MQLGCKTGEAAEGDPEKIFEDEEESFPNPNSGNIRRSSTAVNHPNSFSTDDLSADDQIEDIHAKKQWKRKNVAVVTKLIDEKCKILEKSLSSRQRDQLLLREARENALFRKELCASIHQSNDQFADAMKAMSNSFLQVAECMKYSMVTLLAINNAGNSQLGPCNSTWNACT